MRALASRIVEWLFPALREWRIGATLELEVAGAKELGEGEGMKAKGEENA